MNTDRTQEPTHPLVGTIIGGYKITRKLAEGGMGVVLEAKHPGLGQTAAVKVLSKDLQSDRSYPELYQRFINEARAISKIQHPGIVKVFDQGQLADGTAYILMEYLDGEPLNRRIDRGSFSDRITWLSIPSLLRICRQLVSALAEAHRKSIVHRDLKPSNVILVPDPEAPGGERTKLLDFGIARFTDSMQNVSKTGTMLGTPLYMAPEQCMGERVDGKADVYALGAMMFEMLSGRPPFSGPAPALIVHHVSSPPPDLAVLVPGIPNDIKDLVDRLLQKNPKRRPTMIQLLDELRQLEAAYPAGTEMNEAAVTTDPTQMMRNLTASNDAKTKIISREKPARSVPIQVKIFAIIVLVVAVPLIAILIYRALI